MTKKKSARGLLAGMLLTWHLGLAAALAQTSGGGTITTNGADAQIEYLNGVTSVTLPGISHTRLGNNNADGRQQNVELVFQIPANLLAADDLWFTTASLTTRLGSVNATQHNGDLYGLPYRTLPTVVAGDYYLGTSDPNAEMLQDNYLTPSGTPTNSVVTSTGTALTAYLNTQLANARANNATTAYVFLRINPDSARMWQFYIVGMNEAGASAATLAYTYQQIPAWREVPLGGGGFVTGIISDPTGNDVYIRTDVGGAHKWNQAAQQWNSLTDDVIPLSTRNAHWMLNTMAIALDPSDSNNLYIAAGSPGGTAPRGIYRSTNKGGNWIKINPSTDIIINGNGVARANGERLAIDPNNPNLAWYGSERQGLFKGVNSGGTWTWTQVLTTQVPAGTTDVGVTFVICDKNGSSTITYAGVSGASGGVFRTVDGTNWLPLTSAAISQPARAALAADGTLFVAGWDSVAKMPRGGSFTSIRPAANFGYRGLAVSPDGQTVYVSGNPISGGATTHTSELWRSTDGGTSWSLPQGINYNHRNLGTAYVPPGEEDGTQSVGSNLFGSVSSLMIKPGTTSELWVADLYGVLRSYTADRIGNNTLNNEPMWFRIQRGQEETVPEIVKSPPSGARLLTGLADIGGYRYADITQRPYGAAGNIFPNPSNANTTSLDFSEGNPSRWVRAWCGNSANGTGGYSFDGGETWMVFGQIDQKQVPAQVSQWIEFDLTPYVAGQKAATPTGTLNLMLASQQTNDSSSSLLVLDSLSQANPPQLVVNGTAYAPAEDALVNGATPTATNPTGTLGVSYGWGTPTNDRQSYLKFSLASLPAGITDCKLRLYKTGQTGGTTATRVYTVGVYGVPGTASWSEATITYNTRPAPYASTSKQPVADPRYWAGSYPLFGGRVAISSTDPNKIVWMPFWRQDNGNTYVPPHYSHDRGVTWKPCTGLPANVTTLKYKSQPSYVMLQLAADRGDGSFYIAQLGGTTNIYRSTDGASWTLRGNVGNNTSNVYRVQLVASPTSGELWLADDGVDTPNAGGLWRSTNSGANWSQVAAANIREVRTVSFGKAQAGSPYPFTVFYSGLYAGTRGIYRSDNLGGNWTPMPALPTIGIIESLAGDRQEYGRVYMGVHGRGVWTSP
jgi:hypothetical protein